MKRQNLSHEIRALLREEIIIGDLPPGAPLNAVNLAQRLEVSRTPLREALFGLVSEGLVEEIPRRGFFVSPLRVEELLQLYVIRQLLDPGALELAGIPSPEVIEELEALNLRLAQGRTPQEIIDLDDAWHLLLIKGANNPILLDLIRAHMARTRRYEFAYMSQVENVGVATEEHDAIIAALKRGDLPGACHWLKRNMTSAEGPLIEYIRSIETTSTKVNP